VNLGIIDDTLAGVARALHKARTKLEVAEEELTKTKQEADDLAWVPDFSAAVDAIEIMQTDYTSKQDRVAQARTLLNLVQTHRTTLANATDTASRGKIMVECGEAVLGLQQQADILRKIIATAKSAACLCRRPVPDISMVEMAMTRYQAAADEVAPLATIIEIIRGKEKELCQAKKELQAAEAAMPKVCPTCRRSL
jgi:DNA repair exonuclease SbcCD ATPase subunit